MMFWIIFVLLSFFGCLIRFKLSQWLPNELPYNTLLVNSLGSFLIGSCYSWQAVKGGPSWLPLLTVAFLGALTTFSSFSLETLRLFQNGQTSFAFLNIFANNAVSIGLCYLGLRTFN